MTRDLAPALAARVRDYLAALLSAGEVPAAMQELAADVAYWGDDRPVDVFAAARTLLHSRIRVAEDLEALVLREDGGLTVEEIAAVMERGSDEVRELLERADLVLAEPVGAAAVRGGRAEAEGDSSPGPRRHVGPHAGGPPSRPSAPTIRIDAEDDLEPLPAWPPEIPARSRRRRRRPLALVIASLLAVVAVAVLLRPDGPAACSGAAICIDELVLTDAVDGRSRPAEALDTFAAGSDVRLWFRFSLAEPAADPRVELRWYRGQTLLYRTPFRLPAGDTADLTLARLYTLEPGDHRVEVLSGGEVVAEESFRVVADGDG